MSIKVFEDNIFPHHISDLMNLMHLMIFKGTDGEEKWDTYLDIRQKEYIALGIAQYYQCGHCIQHHLHALSRMDKTRAQSTLLNNISSMMLFLRIDTRTIGNYEKEHWEKAWKRFAKKIATESNDELLPYLVGMAIGIARNDDFLMAFCGLEVKNILNAQGLDVKAVIGELESIVIFMKAASSKNRVVEKIDEIFADS